MKIQETITTPQKAQLILNNTPCGIFDKLFNDNEPLYSLRTPLSTQFYLNRSGNKTVARIYEQTYTIIKEAVPEATNDMILTQVNDLISTNILRPKYLDKWLRIYQVLVQEQYNALTDEEKSYYREANELKSKNMNNIEDITNIDNKNMNVSDNKDTTNTNEGESKTSIHEKRVNSNDDMSGIFGFNSSLPSKDSISESLGEEKLTAELDDNKTISTNKTATKDVRSTNTIIDANNKQNKINKGEENYSNSFKENEIITARHKSPAELLQMELDFRNKQTMMSIILKDVDEETTLKIYL